MVLLNDEVNSGYLKQLLWTQEFYPNLETVSGTWHHGAYDVLRGRLHKTLKKGDLEVLWKIDLEGRNPFFSTQRETPLFPVIFQ